ncbi:MAG TPA: helix-turn-helix domain-containing protein [Amycolatopsis sp.]|uniref:Helix-turn-helix domain-containing protein n=1 Tax=Amycolatopsis nalaikhensis TaxID=715472 RepID=A0ABY8XL91_9PSEU|nr:helix-turn-helix domain-containing protein [Amycolatopsis sp. 2-2]WIV56335.1 helix-turn-helix domain-containing protein [Amycolatopsis sp. 2-2]
MTSYRQHCPVAAAAEVLGQSWTLLVVRELLHGNSLVGEIARGVPGMSSALLARRLKQLTEAGVVTRLDTPGQARFALTPAGRDLAPVIEQLGRWGHRWMPPPRSGDLKPNLLLLDICRGIDPLRLPREKVSLHLRFTETPPPRWWWLVLSPDGASATEADPRLPTVARIDCTVSALAGVWLGHRSWREALAERAIRFDGTREAVRNAISWLGRNRFTEPAGTVSAANRVTRKQFD